MTIQKSILFLSFCLLPWYGFSQGTSENTTDTLSSSPVYKKVNMAFYPAISYTPETSLQLGAIGFFVFNKPPTDSGSRFNRPSSFSPVVIYSLKNQFEIYTDWDIWNRKGWNYTIKAGFRNFPNVFYGLGNRTFSKDKEEYTEERLKIEADLVKPLTEQLFVGLNLNLEHNHLYGFAQDGQIESTSLIGKEGGLIWGIGPVLRLDTRDDVLYPTKGSRLDVKILYYPKELGSSYRFATYVVDFRKYLTIQNEKNVLAFQGVLNASSGNDIPFYKLWWIGGGYRLRGIENVNRYLDKQAMYVQAEYRRKLFWRLGGVVFTGAGEVSDRLNGFRLSEWKYVYGMGLRFQPIKGQNMNIRFDYGMGKGDQSGFYVLVREAF
ncbi:BamA/TamA family outer membrane protein [Rapidithrix thailandica]|uniref:BamA/TamA family outer membrane protein n=1 Tax=Rapidithrix thailandica TaxID=413964 RepID=A0AAW9S919_9BACT